MKILLDSSVSSRIKGTLEAAEHDTVAVADWGLDPGDSVILQRAHTDGRVVVTLDKDFGELAVLHGRTHCGILRLVNLRPSEQAVVCISVLSQYGVELGLGAIVTATADRVRIRPASDASEPPESA